MRRPRCSSNMPIEAEVSPLPRELTTPPVTKMCLVAIRTRLGQGFSHSTAEAHGPGRGLARSAADYYIAASLFEPAGPIELAQSRRLHNPFLPVKCDDPPVIVVRVHSQACVRDNADLDAPAASQDAQLFQFFQLLQRFRRQRG